MNGMILHRFHMSFDMEYDFWTIHISDNTSVDVFLNH